MQANFSNTNGRLLTGAVGTSGTERLATGLAIPDEHLRCEVRALADPLGLAIVLDAAELDPQRVRAAGLKLLIIGAGPAPLEAMLRGLKSECPNTLLAVIHPTSDAELILAALRAGADEFILPPLPGGLRTALAHLQVKLGCQRRAGRVLGVVSAKGGCGASTVACHLALALERLAIDNVLLADLHLHSGLIGFLMSTDTPYSMIDAARNIHRLDHSFFNGLVTKRTPRLDVLPAPSTAALQSVPLEHLCEALRAVRSLYRWVVLDLGSGFNGVLGAVLDEVDDLFVVSTADLPALYQGKQLIGHLLDLGFTRSRLQAVFNRLPRHRDFSGPELRDLLGLAVHTELRHSPELADTYTEGKLAPPDSQLGRSMGALAARLAGIAPAAARKQRGGLLKLLWAS